MAVLTTTTLTTAEAMSLSPSPNAIQGLIAHVTKMQAVLAVHQAALLTAQTKILAAKTPPVSVPAGATVAIQNNADGSVSLVVSQ